MTCSIWGHMLIFLLESTISLGQTASFLKENIIRSIDLKQVSLHLQLFLFLIRVMEGNVGLLLEKWEEKEKIKFSNICSSAIADLLTLLVWVFILHLPYNGLLFCFCTNDVGNSSLLFVLLLFPTSPSPPPLPSSPQHLPSRYQPGPAQGFFHLKGVFPATAHCPWGQARRQQLRALTGPYKEIPVVH